MQRIQSFFVGKVQGVGFRYTTARIAERFTVAGFVRNLPDGRVELVAEGEPDELERFLAAIQQGLAPNITETISSMSPAVGNFKAFEVTY